MTGVLIKIFFVAFVTAPVWAGFLAYYFKDHSRNSFSDHLAAFLGFVATQTALWDLIFLATAFAGGLDGTSTSMFLSVWNWLIYGAGTLWWLVSALGFFISQFMENPDVTMMDDMEASVLMAWGMSFLLLIVYWIFLLIKAGVNAVTPILG